MVKKPNAKGKAKGSPYRFYLFRAKRLLSQHGNPHPVSCLNLLSCGFQLIYFSALYLLLEMNFYLADLRKKSKQAKCVTLKLRYADFSTITRSHRLRESVDTDRAIFEMGIGLLERVLAMDIQAVRLIGIGVSNLVEASQQATLFAPSTRKLEELNKAIDRIRDRYGFDAIRTGRAIRLKDISIQS
jgi:hypothetical protein